MRAVGGVLLAIAMATGAGSVTGPAEGGERRLSFRYDVLPLLARQGCASAYCHGSATGRGGFKLSLFGSDPRADYLAITEELDGRRLDLLEPDQSLLLKKPSRAMAHKGGRKLPRDSGGYSMVKSWIGQGAPWVIDPALELVGLEIRREEAQLRAIAKFGGGGEASERDVTHLVQLSSSDERVASVADDGEITIHGPGKAYLFARYGNQDARTTVTRSFGEEFEVRGAGIDRVWLDHLRELGLTPVARAAEHRVMRRLHLDLVGRPPTPSEIAASQEIAAEERPRKIAEKLVQSSEFATVWGDHIAAWFEIPPPLGERVAPRREEIENLLAGGRTLPEIIQRLLRSRDLAHRVADPRDRVELYGRSLLGIRIGCARCHNHPHDRWLRADHLGFAAFFADPRPSGKVGMAMKPGVLFDPDTGDPVEPRLLDVARGAPSPEADYAASVEWFALDGGRHLLYRNFANRVFAELFGRGLVEATNDHRLSNPAVHESLLAHLSQLLEKDRGDLRKFLVRLMTTQMYAMGSEAMDENDAHDGDRQHYFARRTPRQLSPRALRRAALRALGEPVNETLTPVSPLARQLELLNSDVLLGTLARGGHLVDAIADFGGSPRERLRDLWFLLLSREPSSAELDKFLPHLANGPAKEALRELAFALLASREFGSVR